MDIEIFHCTKCGQPKSRSEFSPAKTGKKGIISRCKKCMAEIAKMNYHKDPKKCQERVKDYYAIHPDRKRDHNLSYSRRNAARNTRRAMDWAKANPDKRAEIDRRYYAKKRKSGGSFTHKEWTSLCEKYEMRCLCCGEIKPLTADHVVPVVRGGSSFISNIQPLCRSCNSKKHDRFVDYRQNECSG